MPTADEHRAQASANREFYEEIGGARSARPDWALTVLFYSAVHEIAALLADQRATVIGMGAKWPVKHHGDRMDVLGKHGPWNRLGTHYSHFYGWSVKTRYDCEKPDEARLRKMEGVLQAIRDGIAAL